MLLGCVIGRSGITIQLPPYSLAKNIILKSIVFDSSRFINSCWQRQEGLFIINNLLTQAAASVPTGQSHLKIIWLIFRGLNFSRNADIGQIGHLWMGPNQGKRFMHGTVQRQIGDLRQ